MAATATRVAMPKRPSSLQAVIADHFGKLPKIKALYFRERPGEELDVVALLGVRMSRQVASSVVNAELGFRHALGGWLLDVRLGTLPNPASGISLAGFSRIPLT